MDGWVRLLRSRICSASGMRRHKWLHTTRWSGQALANGCTTILFCILRCQLPAVRQSESCLNSAPSMCCLVQTVENMTGHVLLAYNISYILPSSKSIEFPA